MALRTVSRYFRKTSIKKLCNRTLSFHGINQHSKMQLLNKSLPEAFFITSKHVRPLSSSINSKDPEMYKGISGTLLELTAQLGKAMGMDHAYKQDLQDHSHLNQYLPKKQSELPARSMNDSYIAALIPLSTDEALQDKYTTFLGSVRIGRLLEDMDIFAVIVCHKHIVIPNLPKGEIFPLKLVTVLIDRIDFTEKTPKETNNPIKVNKDIKISGHVSWVGRSTLEVVVWLEQWEDGKWKRITRALLVMAARDATNKNAAIVNPISPANERERTILSGGEDRKARRMVIDTEHVSKALPNADEQKIIHDIYLRTGDSNDISLAKRVLPPNAGWMDDAKLSNIIFSQPENRNFNNTIFGGFIMRQAMELSWVLGYIHSGERPLTVSISNIRFKQPVQVNSLVQMHASIVYTSKNFMQILVFVEVLDPRSRTTHTSNTLHFTYEVPHDVKEVLPFSYYQFMMYVDGRRQFNSLQNKLNLLGLECHSSSITVDDIPMMQAKL